MTDHLKIHAVILAGGRDFGRCPVASHKPMALWPAPHDSVLEHLLEQLACQNISRTTVCLYSYDTLLKEAIQSFKYKDVKILEEHLPLGSAGCLRRITEEDADSVMLVLPVHLMRIPKIHDLLDQHRQSNAGMTIVLNPKTNDTPSNDELTGMYILSSKAAKCIPADGYYDIKESMIGLLLQKGIPVHTVRLSQPVGNFRGWRGYVNAMLNQVYHLNGNAVYHTEPNVECVTKESISPTAKIDDSAKIVGPVRIQEQAVVSKNAVIVGPAILYNHVVVGEGALVTNSVIWSGAKIGDNCQVEDSLLDHEVVLPANTCVRGRLVAQRGPHLLAPLMKRIENVKSQSKTVIRTIRSPGTKTKNLTTPASSASGNSFHPIMIGLIIGAMLWSYWPTVADLWQMWMRSDEYSSGMLVPFLVAYILWSRKKQFLHMAAKPAMIGAAVFLIALGLRFLGLFFMYKSAERISLLLSIAAVVLLLWGKKVFLKLLPVWLFLFLMLPLPNRVQTAITLPLQNWATSSAVFLLEVIGYEVIREGNIIRLENTIVAVAEACNGLRMVTAFFVISGMVILIIHRKWWEKLVLLILTLPIALLCNTIRLTLTTIAFTWLYGQKWEKIFHDFGGYAMMPLALALIVCELWVMNRLVSPPDLSNKK